MCPDRLFADILKAIEAGDETFVRFKLQRRNPGKGGGIEKIWRVMLPDGRTFFAVISASLWPITILPPDHEMRPKGSKRKKRLIAPAWGNFGSKQA